MHVVFSTQERRPFLRDEALRGRLHGYLGGLLARHDCLPLAVGGVGDHVHILTALARTWAAADAVKELKRGSTLWLKRQAPDLSDFAWQHGYGVFSIGYSQIDAAQKYIAHQAAHHAKVDFREEFRQLLRRYAVPYEERYLWD